MECGDIGCTRASQRDRPVSPGFHQVDSSTLTKLSDDAKREQMPMDNDLTLEERQSLRLVADTFLRQTGRNQPTTAEINEVYSRLSNLAPEVVQLLIARD